MKLKVATWNVNFRNVKLEQVHSFIQGLLTNDLYDIVCLQEVSEELLSLLSSTPGLYITKGIEAEFRTPTEEFTTYSVIITSLAAISVKEHEGIVVPDIQKNNPFSPFLKLAGVWKYPATQRGFVSAEYSFNGKRVRIFSVHPPLSSPQDRADEFALIAKELSSDIPNIVCGDFNILETYPVKLLNWFLRGYFVQAMPGYNERKMSEERFKEVGLKNPHAGMHLKTQREAQSQLDHILVPLSTSITVPIEYPVKNGFIGSDHSPITAEITFSN